MKTALPALLALLLPVVAAAQSASVSPSVAASEIYDGNLFATADHPQRSLVHRIGPRVRFDARSAPFTLVGNYTLDAEYVQERPDAGIQLARQIGALQLSYRPMKRFSLEGDVSYLDTRSLVAVNAAPAPIGLDVARTGLATTSAAALDRGRIRARRFSAGPALDYRISRQTRVDAGYLFTHDNLLGLTTDAHVAKGELAYRVTPTDTGSVAILFRKFVFQHDTLAPSQVALLGWSHHFAARTVATAHAGPRFRDAALDGVEADASVRHGFGRVELELNYARAETVTLGLPGSREVDELGATASMRLKPTLFRLGGGVARTHGGGVQADVQYVNLAITNQIDPWVAVELSGSVTWQQLTLDAATQNSSLAAASRGHVFHDLVALTLVVAPPKPLEL